MKETDKEYKPVWKNRRRVLFLSLIFCAFVILYIMIWGDDNELHRSMSFYAFGLAGMNITAYVFGAIWDDMNWLNFLKR